MPKEEIKITDSRILNDIYDFLFIGIFNTYLEDEKFELRILRDNNFDVPKSVGSNYGKKYMCYLRVKKKFQKSAERFTELVRKIQHKPCKKINVSPSKQEN